MKNLFILLAVLLCACSKKEYLLSPAVTEYANPVSKVSLPDPSLIRGEDGLFYLYATEDIANVPIMRSADLIQWKQVGTVFNGATHPTFLNQGDVWAPDINRIGNQYVLYYSLSLWGEEQNCGIGVATAPSPTGPFTDHGALLISKEIGVGNSIDPCFVADGGRNYLFWGSFRGIYAIELTEDGLSIKPGAEKIRVAGSNFEGVNIHKHADYYYMFASRGTCCEGIYSTYKTVVGRSATLLGTYVNRKGERMLDNQCEVVIEGNGRFKGTGHNSEIVTDKAGDDWILYHAIDTHSPNGRKLMLDKVTWNDGWPSVGDGSPTEKSEAPRLQ